MSKWRWVLLGDDNNTLTTGWNKVGDYYYFFYSNGVMAQSEWVQDSNGYWYYLDSNGQMLTGLQTIEDNQYYLYEATDSSQAQYLGAMAKSTSITVDSTTYTADDKGVLTKSSISSDSLVSDDLISFVKGYEKFYSYKYDDGTGVITQGYGATGDEIANWGDTITEEQASEELKSSINANYAKPLKDYLDGKGITLTVSQFDSLVSCAYNIGVGSLEGNSLMKYIVSGGRDSDTIMTDFRMWNKWYNEDTKQIEVSSGLDKRRIAEANIFNNGIYDSTH